MVVGVVWYWRPGRGDARILEKKREVRRGGVRSSSDVEGMKSLVALR